jgi:hypothetical protein
MLIYIIMNNDTSLIKINKKIRKNIKIIISDTEYKVVEFYDYFNPNFESDYQINQFQIILKILLRIEYTFKIIYIRSF